MDRKSRLHFDQVAQIGCIVCALRSIFSPAEIHHIRSGVGMGQKAHYAKVLPLCPRHHRTGGYGVAFYAGPRAWTNTFGPEEELLNLVEKILQQRNK